MQICFVFPKFTNRHRRSSHLDGGINETRVTRRVVAFNGGSLTQFEGCKKTGGRRASFLFVYDNLFGVGRGHVGGKVSRKGPCVKCGSYYWKLGSGQIRESDETAKVTVRPAVVT